MSNNDHPINLLLREHNLMLDLARDLQSCLQVMKACGDSPIPDDLLGHLRRIAEALKESESHYLREENALFPYLERHGIKDPPAVMWMEHDQIRPLKKRVAQVIEGCATMSAAECSRELSQTTTSLGMLIANHYDKENMVLFQAALRVISDEEWLEIREQFDEIGYPSFTPKPAPLPARQRATAPSGDGMVVFDTGPLSINVLEAMLNTLPVEITFVDAEDRVRYFSQNKERIFVRTKGAIGREVRDCHPQKSLHLVDQIIGEFRAGQREMAEFWLTLDGRMLYIRFFAVRDTQGTYLGCLEASQDVTDIRKLEGEKRLV